MSPVTFVIRTFLLFVAAVAIALTTLPEASFAQVSYQLRDGITTGPVRKRLKNRTKIVPGRLRNGALNRKATFDYNGSKPLGGLFAADFDLTASVFGGWNRIDGFLDGPPFSAFDDDFAVGAAFGRRHTEFLRSEFEFTYRSNDVDNDYGGPGVLVLPGPDTVTGSDVAVYSIMKNFVFDLHTPREFVTPYVGIGIGYAYVDAGLGNGFELDDPSTFAWQPIGGVSVQLTERAHYFVEYRYFSTTSFELVQNGVESGNSTNYASHNLFMGMRFEF